MLRKLYNKFISSDAQFIRRLHKVIRFTPKNVGLFKQAFYHSSKQNLDYPVIQDNERLEFLGDSVISTVVADYLFKKYPGSDEGFLTKMRSKIVKRKTLNAIAEQMGLDLFLQEFNKVKITRSMLGNALEALIGAIYIEKGFLFTQELIIHYILKEYLDIETLETHNDNYKSQILEWSQKNKESVKFKVLKEFKRNNRDSFKIAVVVNSIQVCSAVAYSKKSAEQKASKIAMEKLNIKNKQFKG